MSKIKISFAVITIGVFFALETFGIIHVYIMNYWPLLLFLFGVLFHIYYFLNGTPKKFAFLLLPAGIMLSLGSLFIDIDNHSFIWSVYLLGVGVGLFEWQLFGGEDFALPIVVMLSLSFIIILNGFSYYYLCPFLFLSTFCYILNTLCTRKKKELVKSGSF